jgi:hypothetical protein
MPLTKLNRRGMALSALLVGCALIAPVTASAQESGVLSPELAKLASPAVRGKTLQAQSQAVGLPVEGAGSLQREGAAVRVEIAFSGDALGALPALEAAGATVEHSSGTYQLVSATVAPKDLTALAAVPGVTLVNSVREPMLSAPVQTSAANSAICEGGSVLTEGINQLGVVGVGPKGEAVGAREKFGLRGAGETVGVLSDSFSVAGGAANDVVSDDLPGVETSCSGQATPVDVLEEGPAGSHDEGRAMLQIVHDIAPHAKLAFASAFAGELAMAQNIEKLAAPVSAGGAGADVIVDDVTYFEEPMFQDGPIAAAINKVTAQGVTYLTSAGNNNNNISGKEEGVIVKEGEEGVGTKGVRPTTSWETPQFREATKEFCPIPVGAAARHCLDFNPAAGEANEDNKFGFKINAGEPVTVALSWAEPWYGVKADLDLYLLRRRTPQSEIPEVAKEEEEAVESPIVVEKEGNIEVKTADEELQSGETEVVAEGHLGNVGGKPAEFVTWSGNPQPETKKEQLYLVVNRCYGNVCDPNASATALPRLKLVFLQNGLPILSTEYSKSAGGDVVGPTIFGHNGAASAVTVGATRFYELASDNDPEDEPFEHPAIPEKYSSHGPVTYYYAPVTSSTPAAALATPETVEKPDIIATDCGANTFFGQFYLGFWRFCGTSAAAPHAAGIASIMHQASPTKTPAQIKAALKGTAEAVPGFGAEVVGKGLVRAVQAIEALGPFGPINDPPSTVVTPVKPEPPAPPVPPVPTPEPPVVTPPVTNPISKSEPTKPHESGSSAPTTTIKSHPPKMVKSKVGRVKLKFGFASDQKGAKFECSIDKGKWSKCAASYKAFFLLGKHELKVRAVGSDGTADPTPAAVAFTVKLVA